MTDFFTVPAGLSENPIIVIFFYAMMFLAFCDMVTFYLKRWIGHRNFKSIIISLGILGTFIGISIGLWDFDTTNIEGSVPKLLEGLTTAFFTSVMGMSISIAIAVVQRLTPILGADDSKSEKEQIGEITEQIKKQRADFSDGFAKNHKTLSEIAQSAKEWNKEISELRTEIKNESGESRRLIQSEFAKTNDALKESLKKISEGASKEIINALNKSIQEFNENLTQQFGENFKELNAACRELVKWQREHKEAVEATHQQLQDAVNALTDTGNSLDAIAKRNQEVMEVYNSLRDIINTFDNQTKVLTAHLKKYAGLADKAEKMFSDADERFKNITDAMESFTKEVQKTINKQQETINKQSQQLDELRTKLEQSLQESLQQLENSMVSVTKKMGEKYKDFLDGAEHIAKMSHPNDQR